MEHNVFEEPVWIYVGLNVPSRVETVGEAHVFLDNWSGQRGSAYALAFEACRAAMEGRLEASRVREAFSTFAVRAGILAPEIDELVAAQTVAGLPNRAAL